MLERGNLVDLAQRFKRACFFFGGFLNQTSAHVALTRDSSRLTHAQNTHTHHTYTHTKIRIRIGQKPKYTDSQSQKKNKDGVGRRCESK